MNFIKVLTVSMVLTILLALVLITGVQTRSTVDLDQSEIYRMTTMSSISKDVEHFDEDFDLNEVFFPVNFELNIEPSIEQDPLSVKIRFGAYNKGGVSGPIPVAVEGEMIYTLEIDPNQLRSEELIYTFEEPGTYTVEFGDQSFQLNFEYEEHNGNPRSNFLGIEDITGLTWIFLISCTMGAVLIYRKRN